MHLPPLIHVSGVEFCCAYKSTEWFSGSNRLFAPEMRFPRMIAGPIHINKDAYHRTLKRCRCASEGFHTATDNAKTATVWMTSNVLHICIRRFSMSRSLIQFSFSHKEIVRGPCFTSNTIAASAAPICYPVNEPQTAQTWKLRDNAEGVRYS